MPTRSYDHYCAVAHALDVVGDRWTLLVVRTLLLGPRRFSDLARALPGISSNLLTDRLKTLERHDVVATRRLPPPAAATVYDLTDRGHALLGAVAELARWGSRSLGAPRAEQHVTPDGVAFLLLGIFTRAAPPPFELTIHAALEDRAADAGDITLHLGPDGPRVETGAPGAADVVFRAPLAELPPLSGGAVTLAAAAERGAVRLDGDPRRIAALHAWLEA